MASDFEKHIKDTMNNPPEFPFEEKLWADMESRLDEDKDKPFLSFVGRLPLFLLALLMTGGAGFFYVKHNNALEKIDSIEQQLANQQNSKENSITEKHVTVIYDTIYNRIVINENQKQESFQKKHFKADRNHSYSSAYLFAPGFSPNTLDFRKAIDFSTMNYPTITGGFVQKDEISLGRRNVLTKAEYIASLPDFDTSLAALATVDNNFLDVKQHVDLPSIKVFKQEKQKRFNLLMKEIRPTDFALSGTTGTFASLNLGGNGFNLRGTVHAELNFGKRFSVLVGGEYFSNDFGIKIGTNEEGIPDGFPDIPASNLEDDLLSIQGDFNYFQIPFGVKYIVFPRRYFYPYVGGGLIAGRTTRSRLEYDYFSPSQGIEYSVSQGSLLPRTFEMSAFYSTIGFQVQLNRNWSIMMEGSSQFDLKKGNYKYENLSILKLSSGFRYRF